MRLAFGIAGRVCVLMMRVVYVAMVVLHRLVNVVMLVGFNEMQVKAPGHKGARRDETKRERFIEDHEG